MPDCVSPSILSPDEGPAAVVHRPAGRAPVVLICEHAAAMIPRALGDLGLRAADRHSHAVWDIGAAVLARRLSDALDAPLVMACVSRAVIDCNRPADAGDAMPVRSEVIDIPGNRDLTATDRAARVNAVHAPFHDLVARTIDARPTPPAIITVHSFAPVFHGVRRAVDLGVLHDADDRLARTVLDAAGAVAGLDVRMNEPYAARDGVTHTLRTHALPRGLDNVMLEIRNDLIADDAGADAVAAWLAPALVRALDQLRAGAGA